MNEESYILTETLGLDADILDALDNLSYKEAVKRLIPWLQDIAALLSLLIGWYALALIGYTYN